MSGRIAYRCPPKRPEVFCYGTPFSLDQPMSSCTTVTPRTIASRRGPRFLHRWRTMALDAHPLAAVVRSLTFSENPNDNPSSVVSARLATMWPVDLARAEIQDSLPMSLPPSLRIPLSARHMRLAKRYAITCPSSQ
jgi:hypothetical protein